MQTSGESIENVHEYGVKKKRRHNMKRDLSMPLLLENGLNLIF
jgi:hypothetical protein